MNMSKFIDLVRTRRSIRRFKPDRVPRNLITMCVEAARYAPTACNTQCWRFIVVRGDLKSRIVNESLGGIVVPNKWAIDAPVIVVIAMDPSFVTHRLGAKVKDIDYLMMDAGIAGEHFILQAAELGLGTCWIGWFNKKVLKRLLSLPAGWDIPAMIAVGFPDEQPDMKPRKPVSEVLDFRE
jgi:nitroreductase